MAVIKIRVYGPRVSADLEVAVPHSGTALDIADMIAHQTVRDACAVIEAHAQINETARRIYTLLKGVDALNDGDQRARVGHVDVGFYND